MTKTKPSTKAKRTLAERVEVLEEAVTVLWLHAEQTRLQAQLTTLTESEQGPVQDQLAEIAEKLKAVGR